MSKEKPEVGDVFYVKPFPNLKRIITCKIDYKKQLLILFLMGE